MCELVDFTKCKEVPKKFCQDISYEECKQSPEEVCYDVPGDIHYSSHILFHISSCQGRFVRASRRSCVTSSRRRSAPLWRRPAASPRGGLSARSSARRVCGARCAPRPLPTLTSHCQMSPCSHHPRVKPRTENSSPTSDFGRSWCSGQTLATWRKWSEECGFQNQLKIKYVKID